MTERLCPNCGARPARLSSRFCEHCGAELPREEPGPAASRPGGPFGDLPARFAAIERHPELAEYLDYEPPKNTLALHTGLSVAVLIVVGVAALGLSIIAFGVCPPLGFLPLALVIFGGYGMFKRMAKTRKSHAAPLERLAAVVVDEHTRISGGQGDADKTRYYATLQFADGTRRELDAFGNVAGKITRGDMGIAYIKGEFLMAFGRLPV